MTAALLPNNDLVATGFIKGLLAQNGGVGAVLPGDRASWRDTGFVQVSVAGGSSNIYAPTHSPVIGVRCWATTVTGKQPAWNQANLLAERIRGGCFRAYQSPLLVSLPSGYPPAYVNSAYLLTEPRRLGGDDSSDAVYQFDLQMHWVGEPV